MKIEIKKYSFRVQVGESKQNTLNAKNKELTTKDRKLSVLLEDNAHLRTENQKLICVITWMIWN